VHLQNDRLEAYYWSSRLASMAELAARVESALLEHAAPPQRVAFLHALVRLDYVRERYRVSDRTLARLRAAGQESEAARSPLLSAWAALGMGLGHMLRHELHEAEHALRDAIEQATRLGHLPVHAAAQSYLTLVYRKRGLVEDAQGQNARALEAATRAQGMPYVGVALGNRAWLAQRGGRCDDAVEHAREALALWAKVVPNYPFQWTALGPLLAASMANGDVATALEAARRLLGPSQQWLPDELTDALERAIGAPLEQAAERLREACDRGAAWGYL
jgi:eukaryotic-like serine/threonine-protein kinase